MKSLLALAALLLIAAPARADDITRVPLGASIQSLVATPDGGAVIGIYRRGEGDAIGRVRPDGSSFTRVVAGHLGYGGLGPDGQAWFTLGSDTLFGADGVSIHPALPRFDVMGEYVATGPDGDLWATSTAGLISVTPAGRTTKVSVARCAPSSGARLARASDGALWLAEEECPLIRFAPDGTQTAFSIGDDAVALAPDAAGGMWFASGTDHFGGHIDAQGHFVHVNGGQETARDVAVAPDGSAWFTLGDCALERVGPGGLQRFPTPVPATHIGFDPAGGLWLASPARLVHTRIAALTGPCDDRQPTLLISGGKLSTIRIAALRHNRGLRLSAREPVYLAANASLDFGDSHAFGPDVDKAFGPGTVRLPFSAAQLARARRALDAGRSVTITVYWSLTDREGNANGSVTTIDVTR